MRYYVLLGLVCVSCVLGISQKDGQIYLHNGLHTPATSESKSLLVEWPDNNCHPDNGCYAILQLDDIPQPEQLQELNELGIKLLEYIPNKAYLANYQGGRSLTLPDYVTYVMPINAGHKRPAGSLSSSYGAESSNIYDLVGVPFPGVNTAKLSASLIALGARITNYHSDYIYYQITVDMLPGILACPQLLYTEPVPAPFVAEGVIANNNGRISGLHQGPGQGYDGTGVSMAIGDDGRVIHMDMRGRLIDHTQYNTGTHGELTVGMAAASGNIDPTAMGSAPGATVHLYDINPHEHLVNAITNYQQHRIVVTSTSYGDGCGDSYYISAQGIDEQVSQLPVLLHFFSAGNHGNNPCPNPYSLLGPASDGSYHNTITGGRKTAKNVMTIGNTYSSNVLVSSSSRGPTSDGRLKPDIVVQGQLDNTLGPNNTYRLSSGTSASAPTAAGAATGLYQYYREANGGQDPSSALIKAVMLNSADDLGVRGPDFSYGWGRLNAKKSLQTLQQHQYFSESISHGGQQNFQISIPEGTLQFKAMLYWHDVAGSLLSARALVNDLDFSIQAPGGQHHHPWIPSHAAHLDSLARPALAGIDRINNAEQVVFNNPVAGTYNLQVAGFQVPMGPQNFYIVYEFTQEPMQFIYPQTGSAFVPYEQATLAWDAVGNNTSFGLDFSYDNGQSWVVVNNSIPGNQRNYQWTVPNIPSSLVKFRLRRGNSEIISSGNAVISALPEFVIGYQDSNHAIISWDAIPNAIAYRIYRIGERYMEAFGLSINLNFLAEATVGQEYWFSVAPIFANNQEGRRATAKYYEHFGCESNVRLSLQFDRYPGETAWSILDSDGTIRHSGGPYTNLPAHDYLEEVVCLPSGCFTLVVTDAYGDGMCCENGDGWFSLTDIYGTELAGGGNFASFSYQVFCLEPNIQTDLSIEATIINQVNCHGSAGGSANVVANGGTGNYSYEWSNGNTSPSLENVPAGNYSVTVTDGEQTEVATISLNEPTAIVANVSSQIANCQDGTISLLISGGQAPYSVYWSDNAIGPIRTGLMPGDYFAIIQDANSCITNVDVTIAAGDPLQVQLIGQPPNCISENSGHINALISGGTGNYQISWSNGQENTQQITGLNGGTYSVTVNDGDCSESATITLDSPSGFIADLSATNPTCAGDNNGVIIPIITGGLAPFDYQWSNGETSSSISNLSPGIYQVTITDVMECTVVRNVFLNAPSTLYASAQVQNANPDNGGSITLTVSGGVPVYEINWSHGASGSQLFDLTPGNYTALITDNNGCSTSITVGIAYDEPDNPEPGYCFSTGVNTNYEWIEAVAFNGQQNISGNDSGYGDYIAIVFNAIAEEQQTISLTANYSSTPYREYWKVWIDYNNDQDFTDLGEEVLMLGPAFGTISGSFVAPPNIEGSRRMRVSMQYGSSPSSCINPSYGEVEEYTISFSAAVNNPNLRAATPTIPFLDNTTQATEWKAFPNPSNGLVNLEGLCEMKETIVIQVFDTKGQLVKRENAPADKGLFQSKLDLSILKPGLYFIKVNGQDWSEALRVMKTD